jgi:hypothetical protein
MNTKSKILVIAMLTILAISCKKDPVTLVNESELITTVKLTLTDTAAPYTTYNFTWKDLDGDGGSNPTIDSIKIPNGKVFYASLLLLDESSTDVDTISNEIEEESANHQFFYQSTPSDVLTNFTYSSFDDDGKPLGSEFGFKSKGSFANGTLKISLVHEPNKSASGVASGDITNAGGETDVEVSFPVIVYP